jgi:hypothetical protein
MNDTFCCNNIYWNIIKLLNSVELDEHVIASIVRELEATKDCDKISPHFIAIRRSVKKSINIERWEKILECKDDENDINIARRILLYNRPEIIKQAYNGLKLKTRLYYKIFG